MFLRALTFALGTALFLGTSVFATESVELPDYKTEAKRIQNLSCDAGTSALRLYDHVDRVHQDAPGYVVFEVTLPSGEVLIILINTNGETGKTVRAFSKPVNGALVEVLIKDYFESIIKVQAPNIYKRTNTGNSSANDDCVDGSLSPDIGQK